MLASGQRHFWRADRGGAGSQLNVLFSHRSRSVPSCPREGTHSSQPVLAQQRQGMPNNVIAPPVPVRPALRATADPTILESSAKQPPRPLDDCVLLTTGTAASTLEVKAFARLPSMGSHRLNASRFEGIPCLSCGRTVLVLLDQDLCWTAP
jgi:hypothetical protein